MELTLLLNATYEPLRVVNWQKAITLLWQGKVEDKTWENIVTACWGCNNRKSGRMPEEAGMHLMRKPLKPKWNPVVTITIGVRNTPESWRDYLYWNVELDSDIPEP